LPDEVQAKPSKPVAGNQGILIVGVDKSADAARPLLQAGAAGRDSGLHHAGQGGLHPPHGLPQLRQPARAASRAGHRDRLGLQTTGVFAADIVVDAHDRQGLLRDISEIFTREKLNVVGVNTQSKQGKAHMSFTVEITNLPQHAAHADADSRGRRRGRRAPRLIPGEAMKGNFAAVALTVIGVIALAVNLDLIEFDLVTLLRKWWPMGLIVLGVALYFTPDGEQKKS
jgi:predicted amino acid-binding ACT domain protein